MCHHTQLPRDDNDHQDLLSTPTDQEYSGDRPKQLAETSPGDLVSAPPGTSGLDAGAPGPGMGQGGTWGETRAAAGSPFSPMPNPATPTAPPAVVDDSSDSPIKQEQASAQGFEGRGSQHSVAGQVSCTGHLHATWCTAHKCDTITSMEA